MTAEALRVGRSLGLTVLAVLVAGLARPAVGQGVDETWRNVEVLRGASPEDMDVFMRAMNASLGVGCDHCHESDQWHMDTPARETARSMMRMIAGLGADGFEALDLPSCWTCHRGSAVPAAAPVPTVAQVPFGVFSDSTAAGGTVYENLHQYLTLPANELRDVMTAYTAALGVGCDYCHVAGDWASDDKVTKLLSRRMLDISRDVNASFFPSSDGISCWTCHRGEPVPAIALPPALLVR